MRAMKLRLALLVFAIAGAVCGAETERTAAADRFTFVAMGCMPYGAENFPAFERLLAEINRHRPAFTVHCGDTKPGDEPPMQAFLERVRVWFDAIEGPVIYTPGDNEWTDVHTVAAGRHDPLEWLEKVRRRYFAEERSLGRAPMALITQRREAGFKKFVENARWTRGGVLFATVHVVGSDNNRRPRVPEAMAEFNERDKATAAWVRAAFAEARSTRAAGVALFFQANVFDAHGRGLTNAASGFARFLATLEEEARRFAKPVLLVHADEHRYRLEHGVRLAPESERLANVTRLETFGAGDIHAVIVTVDPMSPQVFLAGPLLVPGNVLPVLPREAASALAP